MPLGKEFSLVADSTASSSPPKVLDASETSEVTKRPMRTYGRRQHEPRIEEEDTSLSHPESSILTRKSVHNTAPPNLSEEIPATSPHNLDTATRDEDDDESLSNLPKFEFGWRKMLRDDVSDDEDVSMPDAPKPDDVPRPALSFGEPSLLNRDTRATLSSPNVHDDRDFCPAPPAVEDDVFSGTVSQRIPSSPALLPEDSYILSSPPETARSRNRSRKGIIHDSDSEPEACSKSSPATGSSSSRPILFTPKSGSSSTQPTSDDEDMAPKSMKKQRPSSKQQASTSRSSVAPLDFEEVQSSETKAGKKTKALSRQEQTEMIKERSRLIAQADASISRTEQSCKHTLGEFFLRVQGNGMRPPEGKALPSMSSDPIMSYSSPAKAQEGAQRPSIPLRPATSSRLQNLQSKDGDSDSDFDPPEIEIVLAKDLAEKKRSKELMELKRRALAQKQASAATHESDDDLEIVQSNPKVTVKEEEEHRRSAGKRPSEGRKRQLNLAKINPTKVTSRTAVLSPVKKAEGSASAIMKQKAGHINQKQLNQLLTADAQKRAQQLTRMKEQEWQNHGGRIHVKSEAPLAGLDSVLQNIAEKGLKTAEMSTGHDANMDDDDNPSDEDWSPENQEARSASPEPVEEEEEENLENTIDENMTMESEMLSEGAKIRASRRVVVTSDSEEEKDENVKPRERCKSSSGIMTEEDDDKENNTGLMYDQSENKENTAVVRHTPFTLPSRSLFDDDSLSPPLSPVLASGKWGAARLIGSDGEPSAERRRPFKELVSEDSLLSTPLGTNLTQSFADKLQQTSPSSSSTLAPAPTLKPLFSSIGTGSKAFSQFSDSEPDALTPAPLLESGFSDLFEATTQTTTRLNDKEPLSNSHESSKLKRTKSLHLTQDVTVLQPAFNAGETLLRKANEIFEKEQAYVIEAARERPKVKSRELYVNEIGFLTQTKPADGSPELYRHSPSQRLLASSSRSIGRTPLRTLSMSSTYPESPEGGLRRLRKRSSTPPSAGEPLTLGKPFQTLNAYDALTKGAKNANKRETLKNREYLDEFFEQEAAESDEEDNFGFRKNKTADDEEEGEDLDQSLPELMDDKEMDEIVVASERVHEKYMEQLEEQDKEDEAFHQGLIQGQQRMKRRHGVGIDDSDDDSEDERNERVRRAMKKSRKSDRGDIKELEANEATRAFADIYNVALKDDEDEFAYLNKDTAPQDIMMDQNKMDEDDDSDGDDDQENVPETFTRDELIQKLREKKEQGVEDIEMDPTDVSWVDKDEEEETPRVKTVNTRQRRAGRQQDTEQMEMGAAFRKPANLLGQSSKQWFAQENKSRNAGTSRSVGGSAITGHAKAKSKTNTGSLRKSSLAATAPSVSVGKPVKAAASAISIISDKSRHFG